MKNCLQKWNNFTFVKSIVEYKMHIRHYLHFVLKLNMNDWFYGNDATRIRIDVQIWEKYILNKRTENDLKEERNWKRENKQAQTICQLKEKLQMNQPIPLNNALEREKYFFMVKEVTANFAVSQFLSLCCKCHTANNHSVSIGCFFPPPIYFPSLSSPNNQLFQTKPLLWVVVLKCSRYWEKKKPRTKNWIKTGIFLL